MMSLSVDDLRDIVARSSTFAERATFPFVRTEARDGDAIVESRLETWKRRVCGGSDERFQRYLSWHGWDRETAARAVAPCAYVGDRVPQWAEVLADAVRAGSGRPMEWRLAPIGHAGEEPFEHALAPFLGAARRRLEAAAPGLLTQFAPAALADFERWLLRRLSRIAGRTLYSAFAGFRLEHSGVAVLGCRQPAFSSLLAGDRTLYGQFIDDLARGGLARMLRRYPVLARCLAARVVDWVAATAEFARRLSADSSLIERVFGGMETLGRVTRADCGLSDPHRAGRTVIKATFASGVVLVYKPRALGLERAFYSLVEWLNHGRVALPLKAADALDCGTHGWMEFVPSVPCESPEAAGRYYRRAGMLASLATVLGAADLHQGNVIACGECPVLVDLEVMMTTPIAAAGGGGEHEPAGQGIWHSVLRTGLLPLNRVGIRGQTRRSGGFMDETGGHERRQPRWSAVNTDFMRMTEGPAQSDPCNVPRVNGTVVRLDTRVGDLVSGFATMGDALQREREALVCGDVLAPFFRQPNRIVIRDTEAYASLLQRVLHPRFLNDGAEWSIELDALKSACTLESTRPSGWHVAVAEQQALQRLDVPLFESRSDCTDLWADGRIVAPGYLVEPGLPATRVRVDGVRAEDVGVQAQCIRLAARPVEAPPAVSGSSQTCDIRREACVVAERLQRTAYATPDGGLQWIGLGSAGEAGARQLQPLGWDVYSGRCGIALFFAALERCGLAAAGSVRAREVVRPLIQRLLEGQDGLSSEASVGATGLGGVIYALTRIARFVGCEEMLDGAAAVARLLQPARIARERSCDVIAGLAGAILGLVSLYETNAADTVLDAAVRCGRRVLQCSSKSADGRRVWRIADGRFYAGFAHGSAGIAYGLARLQRATGDLSFGCAALDALGTIKPEALVHRTDDAANQCEEVSAAMRHSWCRGTSGIALATLGVGTALGSIALDDEMVKALVDEASSPLAFGRLDQLCCGNMGRVDLLIEVSKRPGWARPSSAQSAAALVIERATARGSFAVCGVDDVYSPGMYHGLAGVGYELLRAACSDLPSVLLWE